MKEIGVYIHIPFCKQKCLYCDFVSFANKQDLQKEYVEALKKEIKNWNNKNECYKIKTLYIGGGTPSYIDSKYITELLKTIEGEGKSSITETLNKEKETSNKKLRKRNIYYNRSKSGNCN